MKRICVYCGSRDGNQPAYQQAAKEFGTLLAQRKIELVYGGASVGIMGIVANAVLAAGGNVIGVLPKMLTHREIAHADLSHLIIVDSMHERKMKMFELSDAFVALPGGLGTFEELCEILTWQQLGTHRRPCGVLNVNGFYDPLLSMFQKSFQEGFMDEAHLNMVVVAKEGQELLTKFQNYVPPPLPFWMSQDQT